MSDKRIPKFRITSVDGNTLAIINEEGIVPRGKRADMKLFDESSGYEAKEYIEQMRKEGLDLLDKQSKVSNAESTLKKLGVNIKNKDNTYKSLAGILDDVFKEWNKKIEQMERQSKMDKLEELCKPISDYLRENYCPHDSIVITDDKIRLVRDEIGIPVDRYCEEEDESCSDPRVSMEEAISNIVSFLSKTKIGYELN
jgi:hypothetical protein